MKTLTTSIILSVMFLSAGAFAGQHRGHEHAAGVAAVERPENVTVIRKNAAWPPAGNITVEPCSQNRCVEI